MKRRSFVGGALAGLPITLALGVPVGRPAHAQAGKVRGTATEWLSYGGDTASTKYSPLAQIDRDNFKRLQVAWTWHSAEEEVTKAHSHLKTWVWEATPLMVGGVLYISTSLSQVAAIDAATGKTRWVYDPETWKGGTPSNNGFVHRGVAYWADGNDQRILFGTGDGYLICLNAQTGKPISTFGQQGRIDLTQGLGRPVDRRLYGVSSPPIICPRRRGDGVEGPRLPPREGDAARRCAGLRCPHRQTAVAFPFRPRRGRVR